MPRSAIQGKGDAPADLTPETQPDAEWQRAEHISEASIVDNDKRKSTGSAGLAKQQADTAADRASHTPERATEATQPSDPQAPAGAEPQPGGPPSKAAGIDPRSGKARSVDASAATSASQSGAHQSAAARSGTRDPDYPAGKANSKDDLAVTLGFSSFLEFFEGSQPLSSEQNNVWYTSALPKNQWVLWNSQTLEYSRPLPTLEQAKQAGHFTG